MIFRGDIYNQNISVNFVERIRSEVKFESLQKLKAQLEIDKISALRIFANNLTSK